MSDVVVVFHFARSGETCDDCIYQETETRHYCLLHSIPVRNMDISACDDCQLDEPIDNDRQEDREVIR